MTNPRSIARLLPLLLLAAALAIAAAAWRDSPATAVPSSAALVEQQFVSVVARVRPSVVQIQSAGSLGSGIVYDRRGHIVTNAHVVGSAQTFQVLLGNGTTVPGRLVGSYPAEDLAVIRVDAPGLRPAVFGRDRDVRVGEIAMAIGNPLGLTSSVTQGIVSAVRTVEEGENVSLPSAVQTSAPINPGNSGGALVDLSGHVIGIPTLAPTGPQGSPASGIGFAIAVDRVRVIAGQLIRSGRVLRSQRAYLGVTISGESERGAYVASVVAGGPAASAGIRAGDTLLSVAGRATPSSERLTEALAARKPGQRVRVGLLRSGGRRETVTVTLGDRSDR